MRDDGFVGARRAFGWLFFALALAFLSAVEIADDPARWSSVFYDRGGARRLVEIFATDVVGTHGLAFVGASVGLAIVTLSFEWRGPMALLRRLAPIAIVLPIAFVLRRGPEAHRRAIAVEFPTNDRPNVLVIVAGSIAARDLASAPAMTAFAASAADFTRAYASHEDGVEEALVLLSEGFEADGFRVRFDRGEDGARTLDFMTDAPDPFFAVTMLTAANAPFSARFPAYAAVAARPYRGRFKYAAPTDIALAEPLDDDDRAQIAELRRAAIATTDDAVRALVDGVRERGLDERTVVVVIGDHGETLGVGSSVDDAKLHVPLAIRAPHAAPIVAAMPVDEHDVAATIAELAGLAPKGRSLARVLRGQAVSPRAIVLRGVGAPLARDWAIVDGSDEITLHAAHAGLAPSGPESAHGVAMHTRLLTDIMRTEAVDFVGGHLLARPDEPPRGDVLPYSVVLVLGHEPVPSAIAARGRLFVLARSPATTPLASRAAMLSGLPPWELGVPTTEPLSPLEIARFQARSPLLVPDIFAAHGAFVARDVALAEDLPVSLSKTAIVNRSLFELYAPHRFFVLTAEPLADIVRAIDDAGAAATTLVIYTSDVATLPNAKVPLFLALPGVIGAGTATAAVSTIDIPSTILALERLPANARMSSSSLLEPTGGRTFITEGRGERGVCRRDLCYVERDNGTPREGLYDGSAVSSIALRAADAADLRDALGAGLAKAITKDARQSAALAGTRFSGGDDGPAATYELRFVGAGAAHRVAGEITTDDPEAKLTATLVDGDPEAVRNTNASVSFAITTLPRAIVTLRLAITPRSAHPRWTLSWDDAPIAESTIFLGPRALGAARAAAGLTTRTLLRLADGEPAPLDATRDRGVFANVENAWIPPTETSAP